MRFCLTDYVGTGADDDPFRPRGTDGINGWTSIDFRADCTIPAGHVIVAADDLLKGAVDLGADLDGLIDPAPVADALGVKVVAVTPRGVVAELLTMRGDHDDPTVFNPVAVVDGKVEILLGGESIVAASVVDVIAVIDEVESVGGK